MSSNSQDQGAAHVHFETADQVKTNQVVIKQKQNNCLEIQLGFLQVNHMYEIQVKAPSSILQNEIRLYFINILETATNISPLSSYNNKNILDRWYR